MRIMALDVGDRWIGVSVSDLLLLTAQPRPTLRRSKIEKDIEQVRSLVQDNDVHEIVVGHPLHLSGQESRQGEKVKLFAEALRHSLNVPVVLWDERLTTVAADQHLRDLGLNWRRRRERVDEIAAMLILQSYLDRHR